MALLEIRGLTKFFGAACAVDGVDLDIEEGRFAALLGPSGCGKTTLLRMIGGFEIPTKGQIRIGGRDVTREPPNRRPVNMVFQSYAVFPHMTVRDNVGYGLKIDRVPAPERDRRIEEALALVQMESFAPRMPDQLSGGQRQRVALARALAKRPLLLLLDEPLSALDAKLRQTMQSELIRLQKTVGVTFVIVTHDQDEALSMADTVAVMKDGEIRQIDSPPRLYEFPRDCFVADFVGKMNLWPARALESSPAGARLRLAGADIELPPPANETAPAAGTEVAVGVRPEKIEIRAAADFGDRFEGGAVFCGEGKIHARATIDAVNYRGRLTEYGLACENELRLVVSTQNTSREAAVWKIGDAIAAVWRAAETIVLAAEDRKSITAK